MFVIKINGIESGSHTQDIDAQAQKQRFIDNGMDGAAIEIVEQDTFNPPQNGN